MYGKAGADHDEGVALFHRIHRWRCTEQADTAGRVRAAIGKHALPSRAFTTGPPTVSASCATSSRAFKCAATDEDGDLAILR